MIKEARNSPKTSQATWDLLRIDFDTGNFKSVKELSDKYGINYDSLQTRIKRGKWQLLREQKLTEITSKVEEKKVDLASEYLLSTFKRMKKYEKIIDVSQENLGSKASDGTPLLDPEAIDQYTRSEGRINAIACSALRIPQACQVDVTSKGQSLGESLVIAIEKLRASGNAVPITSEQIDRVLECEIEPPNPK